MFAVCCLLKQLHKTKYVLLTNSEFSSQVIHLQCALFCKYLTISNSLTSLFRFARVLTTYCCIILLDTHQWRNNGFRAPWGFFAWRPRGASLVARSAAQQGPSAGVWGRSPQQGTGAEPFAGARGLSPRKILSKFGGLETFLAIRNIQIDMKLKVTKSNNIMNKCHNE